MRWLLILCLLPLTVCGQARTAGKLQDAPFSQLNSGSPGAGSVRFCINCLQGSNPCTVGGTKGSFALKQNDGVWTCSGAVGNDVASIAGTANQVIASASTGNITLSLPQSIHTGATVNFANLTGSTSLNTAGFLKFTETAAPSASTSGNARFYMDSTSHTMKFSQHGGAYVNLVGTGLLTSSGLTMNTARMLGRSTASAGAIEEITIGSGLSLAGGTLSATGGAGTVTGTGTTGKLPRWSSSSVLTDSILSEAAGIISANGGLLASTSVNVGTFLGWPLGSNLTESANGRLKFANLAGTAFSKLSFGSGATEQRIEFGASSGIGTGDFNFYAGGANAGALIEAGGFQTQVGDGFGLNLRASQGSVFVQAPTGVGPYSPWVFSFPSNDGSSGQVLQTDGSGQSSWVNVSACSTCVTAASTLTSTAITTGGGSRALQTPSATTTLDSSGNISTPGTVTTGAGGSVAGSLGLTQGTATSVTANTVQVQAATSVTGYNVVLPAAAGDGLLYNSNSSNVVTQTFVNAETILSTTASVDMNTATATTLYTCPSGKSCVITRVVVRSASTSLTTASYSFGWNSTAFDNVIANATHTELTGSTLYTPLLAKTGATLGTSTGTFKVLMNTLQGGAATTTIDVFGYVF